MLRIGSSSHGESRLRMLRVTRRGDRHDPKELSVSFRFEGDFAAAFRDGKADGLPPGEALKNLVHRAAREHGSCEIEEFGLAVCHRVLKDHPAITRARVEISEQAWTRLDAGGRVQGQAFLGGSTEVKTTAVTSNGRQVAVVSGLDALSVMRTAGFTPRHDPEADDGRTDGLQRLLVGQLSAKWTYSSPDVTFRPYRQGVRAAIIETFAWHPGRSVDHTLVRDRGRRARHLSGDRGRHARVSRTALPPCRSLQRGHGESGRSVRVARGTARRCRRDCRT